VFPLYFRLHTSFTLLTDKGCSIRMKEDLMRDGMRVLIAYDGSAHADAAVADLRRAGLPREAEALLVSVADGLVGAYFPVAEVAGPAAMSSRVTSVVELAREQAVMLHAEARHAAGRARSRVVSSFPDWAESPRHW
jgi:hypothetical protein